MKITALETLRLREFANLIWVRLHTDEGLVGLGETFMGPAAVEAYLHETVAPSFVGRDPLRIEAINGALANYLGWRSAGVETRGNSAVDIALWDLFGKAHGKPVADMLGGRSRDSIRVYNTCAGYKYIRDARAQSVANWHVGATGGPVRGPRGLPAPRRRARAVAAGAGHHGDEDLAVRHRGRAQRRLRHQPGGTEAGAGAVREDPPRRRRPHGHHGRVPLAVEPADGEEARRAPRRVRHLLARGPVPPRQHRRPRRLRAAQQGLGLRVGDARLHALVPRIPADRRGRRRDARPVVVRRAHRGAQDRRAGGGLARPGRAARLHRPRRLRRVVPPVAARAQRADPGIGARVLHRLVQRAGDRAAAGGRRRGDHRRRPGAGAGARRRHRPPRRRDRARLPGRRNPDRGAARVTRACGS